MFNLFRKKEVVLAIFFGILFSFAGKAQMNNPNFDRRLMRFGFSLGLNASKFHTQLVNGFGANNDTLDSLTPASGPGLQLGITSDLKLHNNLSFRFMPTLMFAVRSLKYNFKGADAVESKSVESAYVDFPFQLKFRSNRIENFRTYVIASFKYSIDMASQQSVNQEVERVKILRNDYGLEFGLGFEFYLPYFRFSPEIKYAYGLNNVMVNESHRYSAPIQGLNNQSIIISFIFE
jgi:hypothetical protein